jgi:hypothetical protein
LLLHSPRVSSTAVIRDMGVAGIDNRSFFAGHTASARGKSFATSLAMGYFRAHDPCGRGAVNLWHACTSRSAIVSSLTTASKLLRA